MNNIPPKIRKQLENDPFMQFCIWDNEDCAGENGGPAVRPEWEHAWVYRGRQIQEAWAIVPACYFHHRGPGLDKEYNEYRSLLRATDEDLAKYPNRNWKQKLSYLKKKYGNGAKRTEQASFLGSEPQDYGEVSSLFRVGDGDDPQEKNVPVAHAQLCGRGHDKNRVRESIRKLNRDGGFGGDLRTQQP